MPWVYFQREGTLVNNGVYVGAGYSGHGVACNRPEFEKVRNEGPIPKGSYSIGHAENTSKGSYSMRLTPIGHRAHGRTGFMIHGDCDFSRAFRHLIFTTIPPPGTAL